MTDAYQYKGYLKRYLPDILISLREGKTPDEINDMLGYKPCSASAMIAYIGRQYGVLQKRVNVSGTADRNREIATRYHVGDTTYSSLGKEYGVSAMRIQQIVGVIEQRAKKAAEGERIRQQTKRIEDVPIDMLDLPIRVLGGLQLIGCKTVGDAMRRSEYELCKIPNFGKLSRHIWYQRLDKLEHEFAGREVAGDVFG
jgi:hypothetical protein